MSSSLLTRWIALLRFRSATALLLQQQRDFSAITVFISSAILGLKIALKR
jgi:hypothetical protein